MTDRGDLKRISNKMLELATICIEQSRFRTLETQTSVMFHYFTVAHLK